jgi:hypothetical protein
VEAIESEVDEIALQGIEFWSTVCDEEVDLAIELSEVSGIGNFQVSLRHLCQPLDYAEGL